MRSFAAVSLSVAVQRDLSAPFEQDWRFPIDDEMFAAFFEYLLTKVDEPYSLKSSSSLAQLDHNPGALSLHHRSVEY